MHGDESRMPKGVRGGGNSVLIALPMCIVFLKCSMMAADYNEDPGSSNDEPLCYQFKLTGA